MNDVRSLALPIDRALARSLRAGERVLLSGEVYAARDVAHARIYDDLTAGREPVIPLSGACIYYVGPSPAPPGRVVGAAGPTTASRVDAYTPLLLDHGLVAMIGKGKRSAAVREAIVRNGAVYFLATGGAGALLSQQIEEYCILAYHDAESEALAVMRIRDFPVIVGIDSAGRDLYEEGPRLYTR